MRAEPRSDSTSLIDCCIFRVADIKRHLFTSRPSLLSRSPLSFAALFPHVYIHSARQVLFNIYYSFSIGSLSVNVSILSKPFDGSNRAPDQTTTHVPVHIKRGIKYSPLSLRFASPRLTNLTSIHARVSHLFVSFHLYFFYLKEMPPISLPLASFFFSRFFCFSVEHNFMAVCVCVCVWVPFEVIQQQKEKIKEKDGIFWYIGWS